MFVRAFKNLEVSTLSPFVSLFQESQLPENLPPQEHVSLLHLELHRYDSVALAHCGQHPSHKRQQPCESPNVSFTIAPMDFSSLD